MHDPAAGRPDLDGLLDAIRTPARDEAERELLNQAWEAFYQLTRPRVYGLCYRHSRGDAYVAEEMCQEAYLRMWRFPPSAEFKTGTDLVPYALHIARFACLDYLRTFIYRTSVVTGVDLTAESGQ